MNRIGSAISFGLASLVLVPLAGAQLPPLGQLHASHRFEAFATEALAAADVDGDGDLDLLCGTGTVGTIRRPNTLHLCAGHGAFPDAPVVLPGAVQVTRAIVAGDLDGDGDADVILGAEGDDEVLANLGGGAFAVAGVLPPPPGTTATDTFDVASADLDGDGDPDLLSVHRTFHPSTPPVRLHLNQGTLAFADATAAGIPAVPASTSASSLALGDVDGDGDLDAYVGIQLGVYGDNLLLLGDGAGGFADGTAQLPLAAWRTEDVALGDVDVDGDLDALLANGGAGKQVNALQRNDGHGVFAGDPLALPGLVETTHAVALSDLDGDGDLDALLANGGPAGNHLWLGDGTGAFADASAQLAPGEEDSLAVLAADLDGDLDADAVFGEGGYVVPTLRWNDGAGSLHAWPAPPEIPSLEPPSFVPPFFGGVRDVGIADLDGDGRVDLLVGHAFSPEPTPVLRLLLGDRRGYFVDMPAGLPQVAESCFSLDLGDVDGDGDKDAYVAPSSPGVDTLLRNEGGGDFSDASSGLPDGVTSGRVALGDLDGDGDLDAFLGANAGAKSVLRGDGTGSFTLVPGAVPDSPSEHVYDIELVDVDADGDLDTFVAVAYLFPPDIPSKLYLNGGDALFVDGASSLPAAVPPSSAVDSGDVDGDGDPDVWLSGDAYIHHAPPMLLRNDGGGLFTDASASLPPGAPAQALVELADADGDGDLDAFSGERLYLGDGAGAFDDASHLLPDAPPWNLFAARLADLDGDGDADAYLGGNGDDLLWFGLARQLAWRHAPRLGKPLLMDVWGPSLEAWSMGWALRPGLEPLPPLGTLLLDRWSLEHAASGVLDAEGRGTARFRVPDEPGLAGVDVFWQAAVGDAFVRMTNLERTTAVAF